MIWHVVARTVYAAVRAGGKALSGKFSLPDNAIFCYDGFVFAMIFLIRGMPAPPSCIETRIKSLNCM